jgi:hypothetical protein
LAIPLIVLSSATLAEKTDPLCVLDPAQMPASWQPSAEMKKSLNPAPWSESEAKDVQYAIETGLNEMISYFEKKPSAIESLWADSVEALIQFTYASANPPELDAKMRDVARANLTALITTHFNSKRNSKVDCDEFERLLPLALFAHKLYPADDSRTKMVTKRTNEAFRACGSLEAATAHRYENILAVKQAPPSKLLEVYIWTLWFQEAELYPDIELPAKIRDYAPALWKYFQTYRLAGANEFKEEGPFDEKFIEIADLAPHIAHIVTGTNRYPLYVEDHPHLYRFHRDNFYAVMQVGELDLFASVVDTLRQYGCTAENDVQVRDGTRFLLSIFHKGKDRWMAYRQKGETDANIDDYGIVHYAWTSVLGIRNRKPEEPAPGTVGGNIRRWLPSPR